MKADPWRNAGERDGVRPRAEGVKELVTDALVVMRDVKTRESIFGIWEPNNSNTRIYTKKLIILGKFRIRISHLHLTFPLARREDSISII